MISIIPKTSKKPQKFSHQAKFAVNSIGPTTQRGNKENKTGLPLIKRISGGCKRVKQTKIAALRTMAKSDAFSFFTP